MLVSEIGEFGLIRLLTREFGIDYPPSPSVRARPGLLVDLGDDALVSLEPGGGLIWTTDTLVAGVHFLPERCSWSDVGWKALAVNVSDVAAMGGTPHLALVTLCLPADFRVEDALELYRGLHEAAGCFETVLGGGDIVRGPVFVITVALSGRAALSAAGEARVMTRSAARPGDAVAVTGSLGDSAGGLQLLLDGARGEGDGKAKKLLGAYHRPRPRVALAGEAVRAGVRCAIDISDGLVQDLGHIATASRVAIRVELNRVPISKELHALFPGRAAGMALRGGEDYELALIAPPAVLEGLITGADTPVTLIGEVLAAEEPRVVVVDESGREVPLTSGGWDHFAKP